MNKTKEVLQPVTVGDFFLAAILDELKAIRQALETPAETIAHAPTDTPEVTRVKEPASRKKSV
jgi:hypothetical protein